MCVNIYIYIYIYLYIYIYIKDKVWKRVIQSSDRVCLCVLVVRFRD